MPERYSKIFHQLEWPCWAFDLIIWSALVVSASLHVYGHLHGLRLLTSLNGAAFLVLVYGSFIEPRLLTVKRFEVGKGERTVTIAFLSDLHAGPYKGQGWFRRLVARTNALGADLILLGGDYLLTSSADTRLLAPLSGLKAPLGVWAMFGNHEHYYQKTEDLKREFAEAKIPLLVNASTRVSARGLAIAAVDDDWYADTRFDRALEGVQPEDALILLVHNPEVAINGLKDVKRKPALMISGHDHGGQIRLPFIGSIPHLPHHLDRKFDRGQFEIDGVPLIIGQGVGESGPRARLWCPPQIAYVTLRY